MLMYEIESFNKGKSKKIIILIIIIAIIAISIAILGGIKFAEHVAKQKELEQNNQEQSNIIEGNITNDRKEEKPNTIGNHKSEENNSNATNNNEQSEGENHSQNNNKLTKAQLSAIENIYNSDEKRAFLSFDDGPSNTVTPKILDILEEENIKATFFVLGTMVKSNPEILKREKEEGHYIANHGYSHVYSKIYANENETLEEYNKTNKLIQEALGDSGYQSNVFRFPGGSVGGYYDKTKTKAKKKLQENGIAYLDWNCLTNDSDGADTKEAIMKNLKATCKGKDSIVVLMHDAPNKDLTAETLPDVISYLREQGYSFKNLYDILSL